MTELEKALWADVVWLEKKLGELRANPSNTLINRVHVKNAMQELSRTMVKVSEEMMR